MSEAIIIALIGAAGVIIAAIVGLFKKESGKKTVINQKAIGKDTNQIGIQVNQNGEDENDRNNRD